MNTNLPIIVCIVFLLGVYSSQGSVLNSTMMKQYVFVNASKEWFKFITKSLEINLSKKHLNLKEKYIFMKRKKLLIDIDTGFKRKKTLVHPLGSVERHQMKPLFGNPYFDNYLTRRASPTLKITFLLDERLRLNLTFHHIRFTFRRFSTCALGEVRVVSHSKNKQVYRYCGIHSNVVNYPQNRHVSLFFPRISSRVVPSIVKPGIYNFTVFYSVIDTKRIVTFTKNRLLSSGIPLVWNLYLVPRDVRVMKFALRTKKYQHFILTFSNDSDLRAELFDGPGTHSSNIFQNNNKSHVTSTFQYVIIIWIPVAKKLNTDCGFQFLTESSSIKMNIQLNDSLPLIISHVITKYQVWKILSYYNVNLTIINMTYTGSEDPMCTFAGIAVYSLNKDSIKEITNDCVYFDKYFTHRDIYSKSNEALLVLYSYKEYGNLSLTMQFSITNCIPVTINTCALSYLCKIPNNWLCRKHIEQIRPLNIKHSQISVDFPISVNPGQCFIFQMVAVANRLGINGSAYDCRNKSPSH